MMFRSLNNWDASGERISNIANLYEGNTYIAPNSNAMITGVGNGVLFLAGLTGNILVIWAVLASKKLQNSTNAFIVSLAITDILTSLTQPIYLVVKWINVYSAALEVVCKIVAPIATTSVTCSFLTLAAIAINRYILITSPRRIYRSLFRARLMVVWITILWVIPASVVVLPPYLFGVGKFGFDRRTHTCLSVSEHPSTDQYLLLVAVVLYPLSLLAVILCYLGIFIHILRHDRRLNVSRARLHTPNTPTSQTNSDTAEGRFKISTADGREMNGISLVTPMQVQITKNMFFIFCGFLLLVTPHAVCSILRGCVIEEYTRTIAAANCVINPIIYAFNHPVFREEFAALLKRFRVPNPKSFRKRPEN